MIHYYCDDIRFYVTATGTIVNTVIISSHTLHIIFLELPIPGLNHTRTQAHFMKEEATAATAAVTSLPNGVEGTKFQALSNLSIRVSSDMKSVVQYCST